jgi:HTH-type transcriptional regulator/antitoxin HigA
VIETEEENERILAEVEKLMDKGNKLTPEEGRLLELLVKLVEDFEEKHYPISDATPHEILQELMRQRNLRQRDLVPLLGSSRGTASEVINGKRRISRTQAKALAEHFHVSAELFL